MNLYAILLDDLVSKGTGNREQIDTVITQAANTLGVSKWYVAHAYGQALAAYANFGDSMQAVIDGAGQSQEQIGEVSQAILDMASMEEN